jgi:hypothetical protein
MRTTPRDRFEENLQRALGKQVSLPATIESLRVSYSTARPFPHILIDGMFDAATLEQLVNEMPSLGNDGWLRHNDDRQNLFVLRSAIELREAGLCLVSILHSASFLYFLSAMTGIPELLPDPYLQGGGYHFMPPGAFFDVHVDRNTAYETGLVRRLGLIIYLNQDWRQEFGGQLELWDASGKECKVVVEPAFNRTIIFEIGDQNYHGVPNPVACPGTNSRKAFIAYYHTVGSKSDGAVIPHTSLFIPTNYQTSRWNQGVLKDMIPPIIHRNLGRIRKRFRKVP